MGPARPPSCRRCSFRRCPSRPGRYCLPIYWCVLRCCLSRRLTVREARSGGHTFEMRWDQAVVALLMRESSALHGVPCAPVPIIQAADCRERFVSSLFTDVPRRPVCYRPGRHAPPQACFAAAPDKASCAGAVSTFTVTSSPLTAVLVGANTAVASLGPVTVDCGQLSGDPDGEPGALSYDWACAGPGSSPQGSAPCYTPSMAPLRFAPGSAVQARAAGARASPSLRLSPAALRACSVASPSSTAAVSARGTRGGDSLGSPPRTPLLGPCG